MLYTFDVQCACPTAGLFLVPTSGKGVDN